MSPARALVSALVGAVSLIGGWTLAAALQPPGFDPATETISALAARGMPHREVMTAAIALTGACHVATAWLLPGLRPAGRWVYTVAGLATLAVALVPEPSRTGSSAAHGAVATTAFVLLALWPALAGSADPAAPPRGPLVAAAVVMLLLVASLAGPAQEAVAALGVGFGLHERIVAGVEVVAPVLLALALLRRRPVAEAAPAS